MTTNNHDKPVDEVRLGRITATIWRNRTTDEGIFYSTQITRLFRARDKLASRPFIRPRRPAHRGEGR